MKINTDARLPQNESLQSLKQRLYEIHREVATLLNSVDGVAGTAFQRAAILGAVSQVAGVPTGAIIERGSNANGEYARWADGTQICTITNFNIVAVADSAVATAITWPAAFASAPVATPSIQNMNTSYAFYSSLAANGTTTTGGLLVCRFSFAQTYTVGCMAIGRWF